MPARFVILWFAVAILGLVAVGMLSDRLFVRRAIDREEALILALVQQRLDALADRLEPGASIEPQTAALLAAVASYDPAITDVGLLVKGRIVSTLRGLIAAAPLPAELQGVFLDPQTGARLLTVPIRDWTGAERARLLIETSAPARQGLGGRWVGIPALAIALAGFALAWSLRRRGSPQPAARDGEEGDRRRLARLRMRFIAAPLIALTITQTVALLAAAEGFGRLDMELASSTIRRLGLALQSAPEPSSPQAPVSIESRLSHLAVAVPEIDRLMLVGSGQSRETNNSERTAFDFQFAVAPTPGRTDLGFQRLLIHVDPWPFVQRSLGLIGRALIIPISLAVLLAKIAASLWPAAARGRRLIDVSPRSMAAERYERAARKGGWLVFAFSAAMAAPWPVLAQFLNHLEYHGPRAGALALALCLAVEALAFAAGSHGGAGLLRRHGWRVAAMLGICASVLGMVGAILAGAETGFVVFWALAGLGDGLARPALREAVPIGSESLHASIVGNLFGAASGAVIATYWGDRAALIWSALILAGTYAGAYGVENNGRAALRSLVDRSNSIRAMRSFRWITVSVVTALTAMVVLRYVLPLALGSADIPVIAVAQVLVLSDLAVLAVLRSGPTWSQRGLFVPTAIEKLAQAAAMGGIAVAGLAFGAAPIEAAGVILAVTLVAALPFLVRPHPSRHSLA